MRLVWAVRRFQRLKRVWCCVDEWWLDFGVGGLRRLRIVLNGWRKELLCVSWL